MSGIRWQWSHFDELSPAHLYVALALRQGVFVVEQTCAYQDADGRDPEAWHLLGWETGANEESLVAYARVFESGARYENAASIGRVCTSPDARGKGFGRLLMDEALRRCASIAPGATIKLGAQRYLESFYREFGFRTISDPYEEDGIIHVDMERTAGAGES